MRQSTTVIVTATSLVLPTYLPVAPDKNPMFLEKRVYQGSSGKVYPLPFTDRIAEKPVDRSWQAVWIENEFIRVLVLPEIGGRIHRIVDKTSGYDLIYHQNVIKPALVGLAGPWASGGIEFNWPQHHRPATFLPVDFEIEKHADGSATIWCSDHDPLSRMKGMHGICLHPGKAYAELKVRAYNRTSLTQTFLWWANVATEVHEAYQSFFPPDVYYVADHARRSMSEYPLAQGRYYGVNYGERGRQGVPQNEIPSQFLPPSCDNLKPKTKTPKLPDYALNDLSFYANIPVPTSYMCMGSKEDFFGGFDYHAQAGIVHIANHHISPGKKQWTWGNHEFGYAWDRNLTDANARGQYPPYIEIMAGVYTDNQPDFSFLQPGETKTWSQYWYPIQKIGPAQHANLNAAISFRRSGGRQTAAIQIGVSVTSAWPKAKIIIEQIAVGKVRGVLPNPAKRKTLFSSTRNLAPGKPFVKEIKLPRGIAETDLQLRVTDISGCEIISYQPKPRVQREVPPPATEPPAPADIAGNDELFITGLHLDQYRHATRSPVPYWREALRRDPLDSRCHNALGLWHFKCGEFGLAEKHFRHAIERITRRNANPYDGEAYYHLGLTLRHLGRDAEAYDAIYKACWNQAWMAPGYHALAEMDCCRSDWVTALGHLNHSLRFNTDNLRARNLKVIVLRKLKREAEAKSLLNEIFALDPLDWWARVLADGRHKISCDLPTQLDLAHDFARAGFFTEAIELLAHSAGQIRGECFSLSRGERVGVRAGNKPILPDQSWGALPLIRYTLGWLEQKRGDDKAALKHFKQAASMAPDYCFPARLEEIAILKAAMAANPADSRAPYYLGNLFYDRRLHQEAIQLWEKSAKLDTDFSIVWRNLGIGYFNILRQPAKARAAYDRAFKANPDDDRLLFERDQLWKRLGEQPAKRLRELERRLELVQRRDDLSVELGALYNQTGRPDRALALVNSRNFQPWEGGEGGPLGQWVRSNLSLGRAALKRGNASQACGYFSAALMAPKNLGEARHLLANQSDIHYWLGCALAAGGDDRQARQHWRAAATFRGDFQAMSVCAFSELTYYSARAWKKLGNSAKATKLFCELLTYARRLEKAGAKIDYFATSLPTMLLFDDDLQRRQETAALFMQAQALLGLGRKPLAKKILAEVLARDPNHALAADIPIETELSIP